MKGDNMTEVNDPSLWWKQAVVYQVYPRSFKDSRGEGLGQIAGVTEKIGYLKELGVDAIWLSPFYPSQLADGGYDVDDYRNVDPKLGTMDDFDALAVFSDDGTDVPVTLISGTALIFAGIGTGATDSFADLVDDPATQLLGADSGFILV